MWTVDLKVKNVQFKYAIKLQRYISMTGGETTQDGKHTDSLQHSVKETMRKLQRLGITTPKMTYGVASKT